MEVGIHRKALHGALSGGDGDGFQICATWPVPALRFFQIVATDFVDFQGRRTTAAGRARRRVIDALSGLGPNCGRRIERFELKIDVNFFGWPGSPEQTLILSLSNSPPSRLMQYSASIQSRCSFRSQRHR